MKTILLIGLGRFGRHVAMKLHELNHLRRVGIYEY